MIRKRHDTWPSLVIEPTGEGAATLVGELDGSSTATIIVRGIASELPADVHAANFVGHSAAAAADFDPLPKVNDQVVLNPSDGSIVWTPKPGDVDSEGWWLVEIEYDIDGDGSRVVTSPTLGYYPLQIIPDLDDEA